MPLSLNLLIPSHALDRTSSKQGPRRTNLKKYTYSSIFSPLSLPSSIRLDLRYTVNNEALKQLGWKELVSWEDGLNKTVE
jgi:hypothetical protein